MSRFNKPTQLPTKGGLIGFMNHQLHLDLKHRIQLLQERLFIVQSTAKHRLPQSQVRQTRWLRNDLRFFERIENEFANRGSRMVPVKTSNSPGFKQRREDLNELRSYGPKNAGDLNVKNAVESRAILESLRAYDTLDTKWERSCPLRRRREFWGLITGRRKGVKHPAWYYLCSPTFWNPLGLLFRFADVLAIRGMRNLNRKYKIGANLEDP